MSPWTDAEATAAIKYGIPTAHDETFDGLRQEVAGTVSFADLAHRLVAGILVTTDPDAAARLARHAVTALDTVLHRTVTTLDGVERDWKIDADRLAEVMEENAALLHRQQELEQGLSALEDAVVKASRGQAARGWL
jgi:BMFP domain-containing protein YqiC